MARIFFVDDDPITLQILGKAAQILGHSPVLIGTGQAALDQAAQQAPDMMVMDMMMPDLDGLTVLSRLRAMPGMAAVPVVILSAGSAPDDCERVLAAGAQAYIGKPISLSVLLETIKKYTAA